MRDEPPNQVAVGMIDCRRSTSARSASGIVSFAQGGGRGSLVSGYFKRRQRFFFIIAFVMLGITITASA